MQKHTPVLVASLDAFQHSNHYIPRFVIHCRALHGESESVARAVFEHAAARERVGSTV